MRTASRRGCVWLAPQEDDLVAPVSRIAMRFLDNGGTASYLRKSPLVCNSLEAWSFGLATKEFPELEVVALQAQWTTICKAVSNQQLFYQIMQNVVHGVFAVTAIRMAVSSLIQEVMAFIQSTCMQSARWPWGPSIHVELHQGLPQTNNQIDERAVHPLRTSVPQLLPTS